MEDKSIHCVKDLLLARVYDFLDIPNAKLAVGLLNKLAIVGCFNVCFVYSSEFFPTPLRSVAVGASSTIARAGALIAPFVPLLVSICFVLMANFSGLWAHGS